MAATPFLVVAALAAGQTIFDNTNSAAVNANSSTEAKNMAAAMFPGDSDGKWSGATVTDLSTPPNDWEDFVLRARLVDPVTPFTVIDVSVTGASGNSFATLIGALVTALNATAINGAAFDTDTLTVAETTDGRGDWTCQFFMTAPNGAELADLYVSEITDGGSAADAVTVELVANGTLSRSVSPTVVSAFS